MTTQAALLQAKTGGSRKPRPRESASMAAETWKRCLGGFGGWRR